MRRIRKPIIKLGKIRKASFDVLRVAPHSRRFLDSYSPRSQRVVVKVKQSYNNSTGSWRAHGRYLERDVARSGDGFSKADDVVEVAAALHSWQEQGDKKLHKIILSPEYAERIELKDHTRQLMSQMERDLGRSIEWVAVVHKNTDNQHVHIAVRGIDGAGKSLDIESYLGNSLRERSVEQLTTALGPRLFPEILKKREEELFANRLTDIDRALLWKTDKDCLVHIPPRSSDDQHRRTSREQQRIRLTFLSELGFAEQVTQDSWKLAPDLRESLKRLGLREQLIREKVPGWEFVRTLGKSGVVRTHLEIGETLTGRIVGVNLRDPFGDRQFMLIEATDGVTYHMNQPRGIVQEKVGVRDVVTLTRRLAPIRDDKNEVSDREFTSVQVEADWKKSLALDYEAVQALQNPGKQSQRLNRIGFAKEWSDAIRIRVEQLHEMGFDGQRPNWQSQLESIRFAEADSSSVEWNPKNAATNLVVGEIRTTSETRFMVQDIRDGVGKVVSLKDVGMSWAPGVGTTVIIEAKKPPQG